MPPAPSPVLPRLLKRITVDPQTGCWLWQGGTTRGYGVITSRNRKTYTHRFMWEHFNGPTDLCVLHRCDIPACCYPEHLFVGTRTDNALDCSAKGRRTPPPLRIGEDHHQAKLSESDVLAIRASADSCRILAGRLGVSKSAVMRARSGKTWGHLGAHNADGEQVATDNQRVRSR